MRRIVITLGLIILSVVIIGSLWVPDRISGEAQITDIRPAFAPPPQTIISASHLNPCRQTTQCADLVTWTNSLLQQGWTEAVVESLLDLAVGEEQAIAESIGNLLLVRALSTDDKRLARRLLQDERMPENSRDDVFRAVFWLASQSETQWQGALSSIPFEKLITGQPVVSVQLGGKRRKFALDTGASMNIMTSDLADEIGLTDIGPEVSAETSTAENVEVTLSTLEAIELGSIKGDHVTFGIIPTDNLRFGVGPITLISLDGILGWPFLSRWQTEFNCKDMTLTMRLPGLRAASPNLHWLGFPFVASQLDANSQLLLGFDSGAQWLALSEPAIRNLGVPTVERAATVVGAAGASKIEVLAAHDLKLQIGQVRLEFNAIESSYEDRGTNIVLLDGILGFNVCRHNSIDMDPIAGVLDIAP